MNRNVKQRMALYWQLMRFDRPIGILLLLWPTLWALWLAADGLPRLDVLFIFVLGVVLMRAAGCVINDYADRNLDGLVMRTKQRPLVTGKIQPREALVLFAVLIALAFLLVLFTNSLTIILSFIAVFLAASYPFMKRYTHLPQLVLGAAFSWSIPMAFAAQTGEVNEFSWLLYTAVVIWTMVYDTFYAMVDRDDDIKAGIKSTAILFGEQDRIVTAMLQFFVIFALILVGQRFELSIAYYASLVLASVLFAYQQILIRYRHRDDCFKAFLNNNWVGLVIFIGIVVDSGFK